MNDHLDPEKIRIPAFLRKNAIVRQSKQKLILTALDRKQAGLSVHSQKALAPLKASKKVKEKTYSNVAKQPIIKKAKATSFPPTSRFYRPTQVEENSSETEQEESSRPTRTQIQNRQPQQPQRQQIQHEAPTGCIEIHQIGHITAYFEKINVAVIKLQKPLRIGDIIQITADGMLFQQPVDSMQVNRKPVKIGKKGVEIGLKVSHKPQMNGPVYKVQL